jgi:hypothetical protein
MRDEFGPDRQGDQSSFPDSIKRNHRFLRPADQAKFDATL